MRRLFWVWLAVLTLIAAACGGAKVEPKPGAVLTGPIEMGEKAQSAEISLTVSDDGASVVWVKAHFLKLNCDGFTGGEATLEGGVQASISDGRFEVQNSTIGALKGEFTSPTAARGSINLEMHVLGGSTPCGSWQWSAEAK